ncbi:tumor necrosis factor receptor superfamily member 27 [Protobothrops mucrosquamatus]|uniref:tumor necrosis factor receptor superfamily member 27 n=1 Tax=Protobothrops mucrosquamatus TaxID=103944 RepID=UPI0007756B5E|nr:tumor necrosis factor receptor superfamily member 27 [Protobothrops mucrosquamatus]
MEKGAALRLTLIIMAEALASQSMANPVECRESEYLDNHGKCSPCKECGPGFELSKECGYGEGREAGCSPCQPRRFKDSWGVHGCKSCLSCALINRAQKSNCSATSDATCGGCFPGFYSKTQIGGFQDLECVPCTKQTPSSEQQCLSRIGLEESSTDPVQDPALVVLTSSALVLLVLVLLTVAILYCQQFWKSQCQHGPVRALQLIPGVDVSGSHLPHPQPDTDSSKLMIATSKNPPARSPLETRPLIGASGLQSYSFPGGFSECREARSRGPDGPAQPSSCARESQHCWPHTPVECTELDLQAFSAWAGKGTAKTETPEEYLH